MFKLGIDVGGTNTKFIHFQKNVSNYSDAYKSIIRTPQNIISDNISYLDYEEIFKIIKTKITEIGLEKISHITLSGQMHSSMLLKNFKIIDGPYSWQSEKNPNTIEQVSSNKNVHDLKRGYPIFNISNLDGIYATLLTKIFGDLTNNYTLIHESEASATGFFDYQNNDWDQSVISKFFPKITLPSIISGVKFYKLNNSSGKISLPLGDFQMSMVDNIKTKNTLSLNIATGGQIAIIRNNNSLFQTRPSINNNEYYDCVTQLPAGRLIELYLKSSNNISSNLSKVKFNEAIYKKAPMCPDLFSQIEMVDYLQNITNEFSSQAGEYLLSSLLKKYIYLIKLYKQEYNFNKIIMSGSILENYNIFEEGLKHFYDKDEIEFNKNDVLKTHFFLLKNNN
tara:strand:+ start:101 stop:1282 length:1182 start_codon:yes stop_codon:yes gene_type:complete